MAGFELGILRKRLPHTNECIGVRNDICQARRKLQQKHIVTDSTTRKRRSIRLLPGKIEFVGYKQLEKRSVKDGSRAEECCLFDIDRFELLAAREIKCDARSLLFWTRAGR